MNANDLQAVIDADKAHVWHHLTQHKAFETTDPRIIVEGKGIRVWDAAGREYIDAVSGGVWTVNVGYGRAEIADVIREQMLKLNYFAGAAGSIPGAEYAQKLAEKMDGIRRVYYTNSGSEANEKAFKMIRQIAHKHHGGKKHKILYRNRDYHGSTLAAMSAGGQVERNMQYGPFAPGFVEVPHCMQYRPADPSWEGLSEEDFAAKTVEAIEDVILREGPDTVGALCLEPMTAGGGVIVAPKTYWDRIRVLCDKYDLLLHIDEVVCGLGRTGTWFGYQHYDIKPDFVTMAKGVASGYAAIGICATTEAVFEMFKDDPTDRLSYFRDISTFGGCTAGPAAALENMRIIEDEGLLANTDAMGTRLATNLAGLAEKHRVIGDVRGAGLFQGAELVTDRTSKEPVTEAEIGRVVAECAARGVIIGASNRSVVGLNNVLMFAPALIATESDIDTITGTLDEALSAVFG
ncbi:MAG: aspartate aminotransferase family protein [Rhodobacterales bacterium]|nr:MAG: aspartate aminotransferase family protein [Rhodobacterales bacterium]